jgi:chorismate mutase
MKTHYLTSAFLIIAVFASFTATAQSKTGTPQDEFLSINRKKIDSLDKRLIEIIGERERVVKGIGVYKAKNNIPPLQAARFQQVVARGVKAGEKEGLSAEFITELLNAIHKESLRIEEEMKTH